MLHDPLRRLPIPFRRNRIILPLPCHQPRETRQVVLVCLVHLVDLVCLVDLISLGEQDSRVAHTSVMLKTPQQ